LQNTWLLGETTSAIYWRHFDRVTLVQPRLGNIFWMGCGVLSNFRMDATTFLAWCRQALSSEIFQVGASEQSGIQIMGLIESRGLAFERLFLLGMISTALPQPVRPLPFLEFEERKQVLGGTLKRQFDFAGSAFAHLLATAPEIIMTRPREVDGEPVTATPFWPEPWDNISASLWHKPDPAWARVAWLRSTWRGLSEPISDDPAPEILATPVPFPESVSVSQLAAAFRCPFRFLIQELLGLKPLAEPTAGLRPEERGQHIHRVLACITRRLRSHLEIGEIEWQRFWSLAGTCVDETLSNLAADPLWLVERRRWLGDKFGLLGQWFSQELGHLEEGWRWVAEEIPFRGLTVEGWPTALSGRIDRLDYHPENGLLCWDYKSGSSPSHSEVFNLLSEPQLPAYLLALLEGLAELPGLPGHQKQKIQAGYISLKAEKDIRFDRLQADADQWRSLLVVWQQRLRELGQQMQRGRFDVDPLPGAPKRRREQLCTYCGLLTICDRKPL
jgi:ATP-dependent helicase/DNAse subunit B